MCLAILIFPAANVQACPAGVSGDEDHECTSWVVMPELTGGKKLLLHKNRDSVNPHKICLRRGTGKDGIEWIALADYNAGTNMGLNNRGLAVVMNSGDPSDGISTNRKGAVTPTLNQLLISSCSSAPEAVKLLEQCVREKNYNHGKRGSIWMIADPKIVYVVENDAVRIAAHPVVRGFCIRANCWHFPEMVIYSQHPVKQLIKYYRRETAVRQCLFENGTRYKAPVTLEKIAEASRIGLIPEDPDCYPLCGKYTLAAATIEIDCEYPGLLSTLYGSFGPPSHTAYLPVPLLLDPAKIPAELATPVFSDGVFSRWKARREFLAPDKLAAFELEMNRRHAAALEEARRKLKNGGTRQDVQKIMTEVFLRNWEALRKISEGK